MTGGGGSSRDVVYLTDSYPVSDSGWTVYAYNPDPEKPRTLQAWAICSSAVSPGSYRENFSTLPTDIAPGASDSATVTCPPGTVAISGGGSGPGIAYLTGSYPAARNTWEASAANHLGAKQRTLQARALCGPEPGGFVSSHGEPVSIASGQEKSASANCPSGFAPISGGGKISGSDTYLADSSPKGGGWTVYGFNAGSKKTALTAVVYCVSRLSVRLNVEARLQPRRFTLDAFRATEVSYFAMGPLAR